MLTDAHLEQHLRAWLAYAAAHYGQLYVRDQLKLWAAHPHPVYRRVANEPN